MEPLTVALWVVPDPDDPFPESPYSLESLQAVSTLPGGEVGRYLRVTEPEALHDVMNEASGDVATLVLHIDVLDDVDGESVRPFYEEGIMLVVIGGGLHVLVNWLGTHPPVAQADGSFAQVPAEEFLEGYVERPAYAPYWPVGYLVYTGDCGSYGQHALYGVQSGEWLPVDSLRRILNNFCEDSRQEALGS